MAGNGKGLAVNGSVAFTRTGAATIASGQVSPAAPIPVAGGLSATSYVLATIQTPGATGVAVESAFPDPSTGKITIRLTANAPVTLTVAWFVFG